MKKYQVIFSAAALADLKDARQWYNLQQKGLGKKLISDVKLVVGSIKQNPFFASLKYNSIRTASCKTFPYALHYEIDEASLTVRIAAVFHFSRKPFWLEDEE